MHKKNLGWMTLALCAALAGIGCGDDDDNDANTGGGSNSGGSSGSGGSNSGGSSGTGGAAGATGAEPIYAYYVSAAGDGENGSLYVLFRNEIDVDITVDDFAAEQAREFEAYSGVAAIDGHVIVGLSNAPVAMKFAVSDTFEWTQVGGNLHFDDYFQSAVDGLNFYFQAIKGPDMFLHYGADRSFRKHWSVRDWTLLGDYETTALPTRAGWLLGSTGNRAGMRDWQGAIVQTFVMQEEVTFAPSAESWIAVYDPTTFEETSVIEVPCPGLEQQTADEDGNLYLSTTFNTPVLSLYGDAPPSCLVRLNPDGTKDETWGNKSLKDFTGGFDGVNFRYLYDGKAVANVLHDDRLTGVDWAGAVDPAVLVAVEGEWTDAGYTPQDTTIWELELIDIAAGTSTIITGWNEEHDPGSYMVNFKIDGRVFLAFQIDPFGTQPRNAIYELNLETATVTLAGYVDGEFGGVERLR